MDTAPSHGQLPSAQRSRFSRDGFLSHSGRRLQLQVGCRLRRPLSKPVQSQTLQEPSGQFEAGPVPNDGVDTALRTESGLPYAIDLVCPFGYLCWREPRAAMEASTESAAKNLCPMVGRVVVRGTNAVQRFRFT